MERYDHAGIYYYDFLKNMHKFLRPRNYLEIGTYRGESVEFVSCPAICVDTEFKLTKSATGSRDMTLFVQKTSDRFFEDHNPVTIFGRHVEFAFLDGLHEAETLLRDFSNVEKMCKKNSVVCLHDCVPMNIDQTVRADNFGLWTGDVWKVIHILKEFRKDIKIHIFDAAPTGIAVCTNLDPSNNTLQKDYSLIWEKWSKVDLGAFGFSKMIEQCEIISTSEVENPHDMRRYFWL